MKKDISKILVDNLNYIYCHNCANKGNELICDNCHRKAMEWELSEKAADELADKIINALGI